MLLSTESKLDLLETRGSSCLPQVLPHSQGHLLLCARAFSKVTLKTACFTCQSKAVFTKTPEHS